MTNDGQLDLVLTDGYLVAIIHNLGNRTFGQNSTSSPAPTSAPSPPAT